MRVLNKFVERMLDSCDGSNHVTEELVCGMLNRAATLGITPQDKRFPFVRFEKWVYPEYVHGILSGASVLGGRALDCEAKRGLGFRPGPDRHILDSLGIQVPRCEDNTNARQDRAYSFVSVLSSVDGSGSCEPGGGDRQLLRYDAAEPVVV